jgi:hypothetical protein
VAGRNPNTSENGLAAIHKMITSISPHPYKGNHEMETRNFIHSERRRTDSKKHQDKRPGIIILGDSMNCCTM